MRAERASTGIPCLDQVLDGLRVGDNVVWQVNNIDDYRRFVDPFVSHAISEGRRVVYMRFGQHPPLLNPQQGVTVCSLDPSVGFESFSGQVHTVAQTMGNGVFYVFDSLSDLLSVWATDLMTGNFFRVTCPYLFELDTIAYFALLRGRNSDATIARIRETTQVFLDLYCWEGRRYVHPIKVWNRYSPTMYLPHEEADSAYTPVRSSAELAYLFTRLGRPGLGNASRKLDYWDRVFLEAREMVQQQREGKLVPRADEEEMLSRLCRMLLGRDEAVLALAERYFTVEDMVAIHDRLLGTGHIGGKAVGMLLARAVLRSAPGQDWEKWLEPHDSFYIGSDVYYAYLIENQGWPLLMRLREEPTEENAQLLEQCLLKGTVPDLLAEELQYLLGYFGQSPIIVRSSSLLEDTFSGAFAGKYESVFCPNQGSPQERLRALEDAVRRVYASSAGRGAWLYREKRGLAACEEQMSLLVQRVSGSPHDKYFFPDVAGVAMSRNPYTWKPGMDPAAGMVRLVLGLGTRAVERVEDDFPRVAALDQPGLVPDSGDDDIRRYSQHHVDVLDLEAKCLSTVPVESLSPLVHTICGWDLAVRPDHQLTARLWERGHHRSAHLVTFDFLLKSTSFPFHLRSMLSYLETAYAHPVEIEFTLNINEDGQQSFNLLQCRPYKIRQRGFSEQPPPVDDDQVLFATGMTFMGGSVSFRVDYLVLVDPQRYGQLEQRMRYLVARTVGTLNHLLGGQGKSIMFIGPGRWGTSTPSLGVPVSFAEICHARALVEVAVPQKGFVPDLSFGTHFFHDLVENQVFYAAVFPERSDAFFCSDRLSAFANRLPALLPQAPLSEYIQVLDFTGKTKLWVASDLEAGRANCFIAAG